MTSKREQAAAIRRLNNELGIVSPRVLVAGALGLVLALGVLTALLVTAMSARGPVEPAFGVVTGLGFLETDYGSQPRAAVRVDSRTISVNLEPRSLCRVGDRIALSRRKTALGDRYGVAPPGCRREVLTPGVRRP